MCGPVFAANTFIQGTGSTSALGGSSYVQAFGSNVTSGHLLIFNIRYGSPAPAITGVTGTGGVCSATWTLVYNSEFGQTDTVNNAWGYSFANGTGACTVTISLAGGSAGGVVCLAEFSLTSSVVGATPAMTVTPSGGTATSNSGIAGAGNLAVGLFASQTGGSITAGSGYSIAAQGTAGGSTFAAILYNLSTTAGSITASITWTGGQSGIGSGLGLFGAVSPGGSNHSTIINFSHSKKIPWDNRKRKLEIVRI